MSKIKLPETSGFNTLRINDNFQKIEDELNEKVLYRDNPPGEPNEMLNDLDMNGKRIYNLPEPVQEHEAARKKDIGDAPLLAMKYAEEAKVSAKEAKDTFDDVVGALIEGSEYSGMYTPNLVIESPLQIFWKDGAYYRATGDLQFPYTTTGDWGSEASMFVSVGDAALRQELTDPNKGAALVARGVVSVDSIADLLALPEGQRKEGLRYLVSSYHPPQDYQAEPYSGGGEFYWDANSEDVPDNGIVFAPNYGMGRFIRKLSDGIIYSDFYGVDKRGIEDASAGMFAAQDAAERLDLPVFVNNGTYNMESNGFVFDKAISFQGQSRTGVIFKFNSFLDGAAVHIAKNLSVHGARIGNFTCNGFPNAASIGLATGSSTASCVDSNFENMRFFNFGLGLSQTYSWCNAFTACRFQSCTKPFAFSSQVNATTYNACSFVTFTTNGTFSNCEGIEFISPNIANFTNSSTGVGFSLFQSSVVMQNPYFENPSAIIGLVGSNAQVLPSSLIVVGGIANPADFTYSTNADRIEINGIRVQSGGGESLKIRNSNITAPNGAAAYIRLHMLGNSENQIKEVFNFTHEKVSTFPVAYTGNDVTYALERDYFTINQVTAGGGIRIFSALVPGRQYTLVAAVRKSTSFNLNTKVDSLQTLGVSGIPVDDEDFKLQHFYFVAPGAVLRWLFVGELQVKRIALYEGVIETSQDLPRVSRWLGSSAPTSGTWVRGDQIDLSNPAPGGFSGLICTTSGTPGVWKGFGSIEA